MAFGIVSSRPMTGLVVVDPPEVHLTHSLQSKKFALTITNTSPGTIAWKLKTNRQGRYMVSPKQGIIPAEKQSKCAIVLTKPDQGPHKKPDKFLIQSIRINSVMSDSDLAKLWRDRESKHDKKRGVFAFQETTVICHLHYEPDLNEGQIPFSPERGREDGFEVASVISSMTASSFVAPPDDTQSSTSASEGRASSEHAALPPRPVKESPQQGLYDTTTSTPAHHLSPHPPAHSQDTAPPPPSDAAFEIERMSPPHERSPPPHLEEKIPDPRQKSGPHELPAEFQLSGQEIEELENTKKKYRQLLDQASRWKKQYIELEDRIRMLEQSKEALLADNKNQKEHNKQLLDQLRKLQGDRKSDNFDADHSARQESREPFPISQQRQAVREESRSFSLTSLIFIIVICIISYYFGSLQDKCVPNL